MSCQVPPAGWHCTRAAGHDGPCAAVPDREQLSDLRKRTCLCAFRGGDGAIFPSVHEVVQERDRLRAELEALRSGGPVGSLHEDSAEIRRLRAENERLRKFAESAAAAFHDLDYERGYLHARAVLAGATDEDGAS